jgi:uncharacterized protein YjiS (DUF1127 family)
MATHTLHAGTARAAVDFVTRHLAAARQALRLRLEAARAREQLERLDAATLRDIGLARSEISSANAEALGALERTRRRLADPRLR